MNQILFLLGLFAGISGNAFGALTETNAVAANRMLLIDPSSMSVTAGKITLILGPLQRTNGVYAGDYRIKVFPYFWKNTNGRIAIGVSDASLVEINQGKVTAINGTATSNGQNSKRRHVDVTVTPADRDHGTLKVWFEVDDQKMVFVSAYRVVEKRAAVVLAQTTVINP